MREYFAILGLEPGAGSREIRLAFRRLARELHPDVAAGKGLTPEDADRRFREVRQAYEILIAQGESRPRPGGPGAGAGVSGAPRSGPRTQPPRGDPQVWRRATAFEKQAARGEDFELGLALTLEEVLLGAQREVTYRLGEQQPARRVEVHVAPGTPPGHVLRMPKQGHPGRHAGRPGDLLVRLRYAPHSLYSVQGNNLLADLAIHPALAVIGGVFAVPLLGGGETHLHLAAGVQHSQQFRVHGEGLPQKGRARGDLIITVLITIPTQYSMEERRHWEALARIASG